MEFTLSLTQTVMNLINIIINTESHKLCQNHNP